MTLPGSEFLRIRKQLGLTKVEFGRELGLIGNQYKTITYIEAGKRQCSLPMARLAWLLSTLPDLPEWPDYLKSADYPQIRPEDS